MRQSCPRSRQHVCSQGNASPVMPVCLHAGQCIRVRANMSTSRPPRQQVCKRVPNHVHSSVLTRPCASKRGPSHASMLTSWPMHLYVSKCVLSHVSTFARRQTRFQSCQHVHTQADTFAYGENTSPTMPAH